MKKIILFTALCAALLLAGCNPSQPQSMFVGYLAPMGEPQAWIDAPLNESRLPLAPYQVVFHITDSQKVMMGQLLINNQVVFTTPNPEPANKLFTIKYMWDPGAPGRYVLGVRAQNGEGAWGPVTESVVFIIEETPTGVTSPGLVSDVTYTPSATLMPTIMLTPTFSTPLVHVDMDTNCRVGPGQIYDIASSLLIGETGIVVGRYQDGDYWVINNPNGRGECWIWGYYATLEGPLDNLPYYQAPSTPTPTPAPSFSNVSIGPDLVYYGYCSPYEVQVSVEARDQAGITAVVLYYRLKDENGNKTAWFNKAMNNLGGANYSGTVDVDKLAEETGFEESFGTFRLEIQMVIQNSLEGSTSSPVYGNVVVEYCRR